MRLLKQSTAQTIRFGPFLDATDGVTEETGLASNATEISKDGGAFATGPTLGTHDAEGWYPLDLTTGHTDTLGVLTIKSQDSATHMPVWMDFLVVTANVYDALVSGSDNLETDPVLLDGSASALDTLVNQLDGVEEGTAQAGAAGSITLRSGASSTDDRFNGMTAFIYGGTGAGQARQITDYNGTTKVADVSPNWDTNPDATSTYILLPTPPAPEASGSLPRVDLREILGAAVSTTTAQLGANAVQVSGDATAADNLESAYDGTGYDLGGLDVSEANQIMDDWLDGGRLDALLDAIKAVTDALTAAAATKLAASMAGVITGAAATGTLSTTQATTDLSGYTTDQLIGRLLVVTSGDADGEATDITDYDPTGGTLTFTALTTAMADGDSFVIV